ncbi:hypothetical protein PFICI_02611 [Pestalotiopsis fici W106-1]|uniref:Oxidoreductase n=1 Tax=Pestalotiopsis fici (strain W106-1 / CGMCC3.15140) TaxID=1229662 RepID=W3XH80_PESFW|nr:uncharacterized protein PFICI_02611 [Pestalotiopsis fici W106-1]ETS84586.1 hypothetical protein PFICI_02611 [Pestalotiopsis fici W106-1]
MSSFGNKTTSEEVVEAFSSRIQGRTFLITGTSANGLGATAAIALARAGPEHIILVGRSKAKVDPVIEEIAAANPNVKATFVQCELSDFDSVRKAGAEILENKDITKIDVILNNAGVMAVKEYTKDKQGYELQLSSNHLGHFLLTSIIFPKVLAAGAGSRIVNVTSRGHRVGPFRFDDYNFSNGKEYEPWTAYGQSKTANILFSVELARRLADKGIKAFAVHPGGILTTGLATHLDIESLGDIPAIAKRNNGWDSFPPLDPATFKTASGGAATELAAVLDPAFDGKSGAYVKDCQISEALDYATDAQNAQRLWRLSEELVGQKFDI